jgi:hypothetical protein
MVNIMTRTSSFCVVTGALFALALSANAASSAGPLGAGPPPPPPKVPQITNVGRSITVDQQQSLSGVHTNIQRKRDYLQAVPSGK